MVEVENQKLQKEIDDKLYFRWVYEAPYRDEPISFADYKDIAKGKKKSIKATEEENIELIKRMEKIRELHQGK